MTAAIVVAALIVGGLAVFVALSGGATPPEAPPDGPVPARVAASPEVAAWDRLVAGAPAYTGPERRSGLDRRRNGNSAAGWALVDRIIDDALAALDGDRAAAARIRGMKAAGNQAPSSSLNLASLGDLPRANGGPVACRVGRRARADVEALHAARLAADPNVAYRCDITGRLERAQ